jgi:cysteine synthase A
VEPVETPHPLPERVRACFASLEALIGDTPLVELDCELDGVGVRVFAKLESVNMTGSIKDRMALWILAEAWESGELCAGSVIAEATSGNTGIALAALGNALGHRVRIFMPDWMSRERTLLIQSLGAEVVPVSAAEGGFLGSIERADRYAREAEEHVFLPHQFANEANVRAHATGTGPELVRQLRRAGVVPRAFVAGVGTGGTVMGVGECLRASFPGVRVHPLEPADSPTLRTGHKVGRHRIQGISDEFVPPIVHVAELDPVVDVRDGDAILAAQRLARELGLGVGISSGANLLGALEIGRALGEGSSVATVFADSNAKYLSTDLLREEPARERDLAPRVRFRHVRVHPRARLERQSSGAGSGSILPVRWSRCVAPHTISAHTEPAAQPASTSDGQCTPR